MTVPLGESNYITQHSYESGIMELRGCYYTVVSTKFISVCWTILCLVRYIAMSCLSTTAHNQKLIYMVVLVCRQVEYGFTIGRTKFRIWEAASWHRIHMHRIWNKMLPLSVTIKNMWLLRAAVIIGYCRQCS